MACEVEMGGLYLGLYIFNWPEKRDGYVFLQNELLASTKLGEVCKVTTENLDYIEGAEHTQNLFSISHSPKMITAQGRLNIRSTNVDNRLRTALGNADRSHEVFVLVFKP